jgi:hypothetical protein
MAWGVSSPRLGPTSSNRRNPYGPGGNPSLYGYGRGGGYGGGISGGGPPITDYPVESDTSDITADRPIGTNETDRVSRPSLFGDFGTKLGDVASGATYVRSSDPFLAFAQGFAGERAASGSRARQGSLDQSAREDKQYQRDLEQKKLDLEERRVKAYEASAGGKGKPLVDDKGNLTAEANAKINTNMAGYHKTLVTQFVAANKDITDPKVQAQIKAMLDDEYKNEVQTMKGGGDPSDAAATGDPAPDPSQAPQAAADAEAASRSGWPSADAVEGAAKTGLDAAEGAGSWAVDKVIKGVQALPDVQLPNIPDMLGVGGNADASPAASAAPDAAASPSTGVAKSADTPPVPGAKKAPDGNWYVPDPKRPGKFLRVGGAVAR